MDKLFLYLVNSLLSFYILALITKCIVWVGRIKRPRLIYFFRLIPIFYLPLSLLQYQFSPRIISIWDLPKNTRHLSLFFKKFSFGIQLHTDQGYYFTPADDLVRFCHIAIIIGLVSCFLVVKHLLAGFKAWSFFRKIGAQKWGRFIYLTDSKMICSPLATMRRIFIPTSWKNTYDAKQLVAVVQHEKNHIFWQDTAMQFLTELLVRIYWFIPGLTAWKRKTYCYRECACDAYARKKGVSSLVLMEAIHKATQNNFSSFSCGFHESTSLRRVQSLIHEYKPQNRVNIIGGIICFTLLSIFLFRSSVFIF